MSCSFISKSYVSSECLTHHPYAFLCLICIDLNPSAHGGLSLNRICHTLCNIIHRIFSHLRIPLRTVLYFVLSTKTL